MKYLNVFGRKFLQWKEETIQNFVTVYSTSTLPERKDPKLDPLPGLGLRKSDVNR